MFNLNHIVLSILTVALVMFSAIIHEMAHGYAALALGDTTAKDAGRLTLNPFAHIDPFGSVLLPLLMSFAGGPVFAFAKPVPYNPLRLKNRKRDELLVALAGPASNIAQALIGAFLTFLVVRFSPFELLFLQYWLLRLVTIYTYINLVLAFFNLLPLPPLDGSAIIAPFLSDKALQKYYQIQQISLPLLFLILYIVPSILHFDIIGRYLDLTAGNLFQVLMSF